MQSDDPQRRLPPPVLAKRKKRSKPKRRPWYRHAAWAIPLAACAVFVILIVGGLTVRHVVVDFRQPSIEQTSSAGVNSSANAERSSLPGTSPDREADSFPGYEPDSDEPQLNVLPPLAAREKGRKLRKMLLVGPQADMFPDLNAALEAAIPGDIIEIRTNRPIVLRRHELVRPDVSVVQPLTIRGGSGYNPVVRVQPWLETTVPIRLARIHFAIKSGGGMERFLVAKADVQIRDCSFTKVGDGTHATVVHTPDDAEHPLEIQMQNCFIRGPHLGQFGHRSSVRMVNCLRTGEFHTLEFFPARPDSDVAHRRRAQIERCTFVGIGSNGGYAFSVNLHDVTAKTDLLHAPLEITCRSSVIANEHLMKMLSRGVTPDWWANESPHARVTWWGERNIYRNVELAYFMPDSVRYRTRNLEQWREFWPNPTDQDSVHARVTFVGEMQGVGNKLKLHGLPPNFAMAAIEDVPVLEYEGIGCDVTQLPIPPPVTTESY